MSAEYSDDIKVQRDNFIVTVTLNRPQRKNAVTSGMWHALGDLFLGLRDDSSARVVVLRGAGADFSAGADISEFDSARGDSTSAKVYEESNSRAFAAIRTCPIPVIASICGICFGGGFGIAAACDIRLASNDAVFSVPAAKLGLAYPQDAMIDIVTACGPQMARYLTYSGARISTAEVLGCGFLLAAYDSSEIHEAAIRLAITIAENAPLSVKASKAAISAVLTGSPQDAGRARQLGAATFDSDDYREGRAAFSEKRKAQFRGP
jgi:enoyl-CoA hydratase/carnithine racemase